MYRIYFDSNERTVEGNYILSIPGSLKDMEPIADRLHDGLRVIIYMGREVEMEAVLEFNPDPKWGGWTAKAIDGTIKYPDEDQ